MKTPNATHAGNNFEYLLLAAKGSRDYIKTDREYSKANEINKNMIAQLRLLLLSFQRQRSSLYPNEIPMENAKQALRIKRALRALLQEVK